MICLVLMNLPRSRSRCWPMVYRTEPVYEGLNVLVTLLFDRRFIVASMATLVPQGSCCEKLTANWCRRLLSDGAPIVWFVLTAVSRLIVLEKRIDGCSAL